MDKLKHRILTEGVALGSDRINVDGFINHRIDTSFMDEIGEEFARRFAGVKVDKILTVEASGIAIAVSAARYFGFCPVVFAKKSRTSNTPEDSYSATVKSFTRGTVNDIYVSKKYLHPGDRVLIIDDFMATGEASKGLVEVVRASGAEVAGIGIAIEKAFQPGGDELRAMGIQVESLARIKEMSSENGILFA